MAAKLQPLGGTQKKKGKPYPFIGAKMAVKLQPLGDRVVVRPSSKEEVTRGGIVIPDTAKEKPQEGEVIAAGPGRMTEDGKRIAMDVKVGDIVIYAKYGGSELKENDEELIILRESDILAKKSSK
ncbi:MAG: co-chaperone GroES [Chloroflexi bacterium]|nr:co-chaperone GroES [Chloroflexota bacterium]MBL7061967.1 co-chaperone GroES [Dehalococcoidia bacterium]